MSLVGEIVAAKSVELGFKAANKAVGQIVGLKPPELLVAILYEQFGETTGLSRRQFRSWLDDVELRAAFEDTINGNSTPADAPYLARLIEPHLVSISDEVELARAIADSAIYVAPIVTRDQGSHVAHKIDRLSEAIREGNSERDVTESDRIVIEAFLVDPLEKVGRKEDAEEAHRLADRGEHSSAAEVFEEIAGEFRERGLEVIAETYSKLASDMFVEAGENGRAIAGLFQVAEEQIERGSGSALFTIRKLRDALPEDEYWKALALEARIAFGENEQDSIEALRIAVEKSGGSAMSRGYVAELTDLLAYAGFEEQVESVGSEFVSTSLESVEVLRIRMNLADASSNLRSEPSKSARWNELLAEIDEDRDPIWAGIAWQRRGADLARSGEVEACERAYRRAIKAFAKVPDYDEQAADAFYSLQSAALQNGKLFSGNEVRALAYEQRGPANTPVARAERLTYLAMDNRLSGRQQEALRQYAAALELHRRSGSLQGMLEVSHKLGELFLDQGRAVQAAKWFIRAGRGKEAVAAAGGAAPSQLAEVLQLRESKWERAASLSVIREFGDRLPLTFTRSIVPWLIEEARGEITGIFAPQPSFQARMAIAKILPVLEGEPFLVAFEVTLEGLESGHFEIRHAAEAALVAATALGRGDASDQLIDSFLDDPYNSHVPVGFVATLSNSEAIARKLKEKAEDAFPVLAALVLADRITGDAQLQELCDRAARHLAEAKNVEVGEGSISIGIGADLSTIAIAARGARAEEKDKAVKRLIEILNDPRDHEMNRRIAANAIFNLSSSVSPDTSGSLIAVLEPISMGIYETVDHGEGFMSFPPLALRAAALGALSRLFAVNPNLDSEPLKRSINLAFQGAPDDVTVAAVEALTQNPQIPSPVSLELLLSHPSSGIRTAVVLCWSERREDPLPVENSEALVCDQSLHVRDAVLTLASIQQDRKLLTRFIDSDPEPIVVVKARKLLAEIDAAGRQR